MHLLVNIKEKGNCGGIYITTSIFSYEAIHFAEKSHILLIDNDELEKLIYKYKSKYAIKIKFYEMDGFDKEKYFSIKYNYYYDSLKLRKFLQTYIDNDCYEINRNGLIDEYICINNNDIHKEDKNKRRTQIGTLEFDMFRQSCLYLLKGNILLSLKNMFSIIKYIKNPIIDVSIYSEWQNYIQNENEQLIFYDSSIAILLKNKMFIFYYFRFDEGIEYIHKYIDRDIKKMEIGRKEHIKFEQNKYDKNVVNYRKIIKQFDEIIIWPIGIYPEAYCGKFRFGYNKSKSKKISDYIEEYRLDYNKIRTDLYRNKEEIIELISSLDYY